MDPENAPAARLHEGAVRAPRHRERLRRKRNRDEWDRHRGTTEEALKYPDLFFTRDDTACRTKEHGAGHVVCMSSPKRTPLFSRTAHVVCSLRIVLSVFPGLL